MTNWQTCVFQRLLLRPIIAVVILLFIVPDPVSAQHDSFYCRSGLRCPSGEAKAGGAHLVLEESSRNCSTILSRDPSVIAFVWNRRFRHCLPLRMACNNDELLMDFDPEVDYCVRVCKMPQLPENLNVSYNTGGISVPVVNTTLNFTCASNQYDLIGASTINCLSTPSGAELDSLPPVCAKKPVSSNCTGNFTLRKPALFTRPFGFSLPQYNKGRLVLPIPAPCNVSYTILAPIMATIELSIDRFDINSSDRILISNNRTTPQQIMPQFSSGFTRFKSSGSSLQVFIRTTGEAVASSFRLYFSFVYDCSNLSLTNGEVVYSYDDVSSWKMLRSRTATFRCHSRFLLVGSSTAICLANGNWSFKIPHCIDAEATASQTEPIAEVGDKLTPSSGRFVYRPEQLLLELATPGTTVGPENPRTLLCPVSTDWTHWAVTLIIGLVLLAAVLIVFYTAPFICRRQQRKVFTRSPGTVNYGLDLVVSEDNDQERLSQTN